MRRNKLLLSFGLVLWLTAMGNAPFAAAQEIGISETPAIMIAETPPPNANEAGLVTAEAAGFATPLWAGMTQENLVAQLRAVHRGIESSAVRGVYLRAILAASEIPMGEKDMIAERAETLLRTGHTLHAENLLKAVEEGVRKPRQKELAFILNVLHGTAKPEAICNTAAKNLAKKASPFWQRWVVLCQAKSGETEKAELGLTLLDERGQDSELYLKLVQGVLSKKPINSLPQIVYLEHTAWLHFAGLKAYLQQSKNPPLSYAALYVDHWKKLATQYGLAGNTPPAVSQETSFTPSLAYLKLPASGASAKDKRLAFLAYGLRKAFGQPVSLETEAELNKHSYEAAQIVTSPSWRESIRKAAEAQETGKLALLLAAVLNQPLSQYDVADIVLAVTALYRAGLEADAVALAKEALSS
jgi:hypothetical protein